MSIGATAAVANSPPPPPPATSSGGGGTPPPSSTPPPSTVSTPPPDTRAPGRIGHLRAITKVPKRITLQWSNPGASDLAGIVVRRAWGGACPASPRDGVQIGGTSVRKRQIDTGAADNTRYCYAVFAFDHHGNYSHARLARSVMNPGDQTAPGPVTGLTAEPGSGQHVVLSWHNPAHAGIAFIAVRRGVVPNCPTGPADGTPVGGQSVRTSQVDATAKPGISYCYRVYALDAAGNASVANSDADATAPKPAAPAPAPHPHATASAASSGGWLSSTLMHVVAGVGLTMLLVMAAATAVTRRRSHTSAYLPTREAGMRLAMNGYAPVALVIPALLVLGSCAAIALVLLNL